MSLASQETASPRHQDDSHNVLALADLLVYTRKSQSLLSSHDRTMDMVHRHRQCTLAQHQQEERSPCQWVARILGQDQGMTSSLPLCRQCLPIPYTLALKTRIYRLMPARRAVHHQDGVAQAKQLPRRQRLEQQDLRRTKFGLMVVTGIDMLRQRVSL